MNGSLSIPETNSNLSKNHQPWIERYRPTKFQDIVLDPLNKKIFENILKREYFVNLLFYGPPGTGKTTTIINLINEFQAKYSKNNKGSAHRKSYSKEVKKRSIALRDSGLSVDEISKILNTAKSNVEKWCSIKVSCSSSA